MAELTIAELNELPEGKMIPVIPFTTWCWRKLHDWMGCLH